MNLLASKHGRVAATKPEGLQPANEAGSEQLLAADVEAYWLANAHGFRVESPRRKLGVVEDLRLDAAGRPKSLLVAGGLLGFECPRQANRRCTTPRRLHHPHDGSDEASR